MTDEQELPVSESGLEQSEIIETTDEDGAVHLFEKVDEFEVDEQRYALMIYLGEQDEDGKVPALPSEEGDGYEEEVLAMRIVRENDMDVFESIDDETEFNRVVKFLETYEGDDVTVDLQDVLDAMNEVSPN